MATSVHKRIKIFWLDDALQQVFIEEVVKSNLEMILWPESNPNFFGRKFVVVHGKKKMPYPLIQIQDRLYFAEKFVEYYAMHARDIALNPVVAYYYLFLFRQRYIVKKTTRKKALSKRDQNRRKVFLKIGKIIRMLDIPVRIKRIKDNKKLITEALLELQSLTSKYSKLEDENRAFSIETEIFQRSRSQRYKDQKYLGDLESENVGLKNELHRQTNRVATLESDFRKMADKILGDNVADERSLINELSLLRHEYNLISQKYDALVSKNIDLSNRLETKGPTLALEDILNSVRDKINRILRTAASSSDEILLSGLRFEIEQLQRSRIYLGRALYDIGLLYLRSGNKDHAIRELKAARELGVENFETNSIIGIR